MTQSLRYWQWRVLLCVMGCYLFYYTGRYVIGHALPLMERDLGYSAQQLGWLSSALLVAYALGQAVNGNVGDWLGGRRMMALGALASMLLCWAFSFASSLVWLGAFWALNGFAQSMGWAPGSRLLSNWWPRRRRGIAFGLYLLAAGFATVLVWLTSIAVLRWTDDQDPSRWRWLFRLPVLALGVAGLLFYLLVRERPEDVGLAVDDDDALADMQAPSDGEGAQTGWLAAVKRYFLILRNGPFDLACLVIFLENFARLGLLTWMVKYYDDSGVKIEDSLLITLSLPIGMGLGAFAGGLASDTLFQSRRTGVVALFLLVSAVCFALLRAAPVSAESSKLVGVALLFFVGFFVYGAQGPLWALCPDLVGRENTGTAVGVMDAIAYVGAAAQGPLLGYCIDHPERLGYPAVFLLLAVAAGTAALLAAMIRR